MMLEFYLNGLFFSGLQISFIFIRTEINLASFIYAWDSICSEADKNEKMVYRAFSWSVKQLECGIYW